MFKNADFVVKHLFWGSKTLVDSDMEDLIKESMELLGKYLKSRLKAVL